ncbi:MAG TPA: imidazole glycerol phosphate synthase subunit HisH [Rhizomicrobium sp.]|nr:imidazole glycerol phosphate synthase subunit HisH [Rhizomicrobium sp.]
MTVTALIDYGSGNLASAAKALARAANGKSEIVTTADPQVVKDAERIVLPGVGAFADCMKGLCSVPGMVEALRDKVVKDGAPFLGICVGMQLLATVGVEFGRHAGLGWIAGEVVKIAPNDHGLKIPHMGWNELNILTKHPLLKGIEPGAHTYFVHSYQLKPALPEDLIATTDYGGPLTAMVGNENIAGTQFHPEKSQATGLKLLENFLTWRP